MKVPKVDIKQLLEAGVHLDTKHLGGTKNENIFLVKKTLFI